jgi:hypothetical protein
MTIPSRPRRNRATRAYHRTGAYPVERALPFLVERVKDPHVADDALTPVERGARAWRGEVLRDLGGPEAVSAAKLALVEAALGTKIVLDSLDRYLFELAGIDGLANRRNRRAYSIVADRMRVADSLTRQLAVLGIDRVERPPVALQEYLARRSSGSAPPVQPTEGDHHVDDDVRELDPDGHIGP